MLIWLRRRSDAPRVVVEVGGFDKGGLEKVALDSTLAWQRAGMATLIVSAGSLGESAAAARAAGLAIAALPAQGKLRRYARLLRTFRPTVAVSHFSTLGYGLFAARRLAVVAFIHNVYAFMDEAQRHRFAADDRLVARYISVSPRATAYATARLGIVPARIETIPNGLDLAAYAHRAAAARPVPRAPLGIGAEDYVFLNVASYNLHKGHYLMAAALRRVLAVRADIRIVCLGNVVNPTHLAALRAHLDAAGLAAHMILPGYAPRVEDWYTMADAFLLPSFIEGWSIAMNEAMFFARPMILTDTGAASEVIEQEDTGILVPNEYGDVTALDSAQLDSLAYQPRDYRVAADLARAMLRFAADRDRWAAAGRRGYAKLRVRYDLRATSARQAAVLRALGAPR